jgi:hypothetical protein
VGRVVKEECKRGRTTETMSWLNAGEKPAIKMRIEGKDAAVQTAKRWTKENHAHINTW